MQYENLAVEAARLQNTVDAAITTWAGEMTAAMLRGGNALLKEASESRSHRKRGEFSTHERRGAVETVPSGLLLWEGQFAGVRGGLRCPLDPTGRLCMAALNTAVHGTGVDLCVVHLIAPSGSDDPGVRAQISVGRVETAALNVMVSYLRGEAPIPEDSNVDELRDLLGAIHADVDLAFLSAEPLGLPGPGSLLDATRRAAAAIPVEFAPFQGAILGWLASRVTA